MFQLKQSEIHKQLSFASSFVITPPQKVELRVSEQSEKNF